MAKVTNMKYRCECGAEDHVKLFEGEAPPLTFNCWNCKGGRGMEVQDMIQHGKGMFPVLKK